MRISLYMVYFSHQKLQILLDDLFFLIKGYIFSNGFSTCICVRIFNSQNAFIQGVSASCLLHVTHDDTLGAEGLAQIRVEEFVAFLVRLAVTKSQWFVTCWDTHMTLEYLRLMEVSVVVQTEICLVIDTVKIGRSRFFSLMEMILVVICLISTHS